MARLTSSIAIIGAGSMGGAIALGLVESDTLEASHVSVFDTSQACLDRMAAHGVSVTDSIEGLIAQDTDVVLLAVKPQVLPEVLNQVAPMLAGRLVVSIAAGVRLATLEDAMPKSRVVRVMPNLPIQVLSGASAICGGVAATDEDVRLVRELFGALGSAEIMSETQLDVAGAVSGCGPAYFALFVDDLTRAGIRAGLPAAACRSMVLATMRGVADQLIESGEHPRAYMERVTSPGGTTAAGLQDMEADLFFATSAAVDAALERTRELAGE